MDENTTERKTSMRELAAEMSILKQALLDPEYDLLEDNYKIIEDVRDFVNEYNNISARRWNGEGLLDLLMLRVRNKSRHVYAITIGQFPEIEKIVEERWKKEGMKDPEGFLWLMPR